VQWSSTNPELATVSAATGAEVTVRGVKVGIDSIIAQIGGHADTAVVRVIPPVAGVAFGESPSTATAGECLPLAAVARDANGATLGRVITYESEDPLVATVNDEGRACWEAIGSTTITATSEGVSESFDVEVKGVPLTVVGIARDATDVGHGFAWTETGGLQAIPAPSGVRNVTATGANANGQIVGWGSDASGLNHSFVYTRGRGVRELPLAAGANGATVRMINNLGQAVGANTFPDGISHAVVWVITGPTIELIDLGTLVGGRFANVTAANNKGQLVGVVRTPEGDQRPYRLSSPSDRSPRIFEIPGMTGADVYGINENGFVVGAYADAAGTDRPFFFDGTTVRDLGLPAGCNRALAFGISTSGRIAVTGLDCSGRSSSFYTNTTGGSYTQINPERQTETRAVSPEGHVVGFSLLEGRNRAVLWRGGSTEPTYIPLFPGEKSMAAYGITAGGEQ
jgi:probable HAF family extracellular repeat protein